MRASLTGVSLPTLHRMIEARLRSRRIFSASMRRAGRQRLGVGEIDPPVDRDLAPHEQARARRPSASSPRCADNGRGGRNWRGGRRLTSVSRARAAAGVIVAASDSSPSSSSCRQMPRRKIGWPLSRMSSPRTSIVRKPMRSASTSSPAVEAHVVEGRALGRPAAQAARRGHRRRSSCRRRRWSRSVTKPSAAISTRTGRPAAARAVEADGRGDAAVAGQAQPGVVDIGLRAFAISSTGRVMPP